MASKDEYPDWSGKTILIAEDIDSNYTILATLLSKTQVKLLRAHNGVEAINLVRNNQNIDVILMDISMPNLDGIKAMKTIRAIIPEQIIIAQTAHSMDAFLAGENFNDILLKPILRIDLFYILNKYLS